MLSPHCREVYSWKNLYFCFFDFSSLDLLEQKFQSHSNHRDLNSPVKKGIVRWISYLIQVYSFLSECESFLPCSQGRLLDGKALRHHPWGRSLPCRDVSCTSCEEGTPESRGGEQRTYDETAEQTRTKYEIQA